MKDDVPRIMDVILETKGTPVTVHLFMFMHPVYKYVRRYWHRSLNPRKLIEVKFSHLSRNMTMQRTMKLYRLPEVHTSSVFQTPACLSFHSEAGIASFRSRATVLSNPLDAQ